MRSCIILMLAVLICACSTSSNEVIEGILEVPENRNDSNSRTLKLVYKVLKAKTSDSLKAPIVYLMGGPGGATLITEEFWENNPLRKDRDIVLMDQRGTGNSEANCTEMGAAMFDIMRQDLDAKGEINALKTIFSECKETMKNDGVDLAGYNSRENAADFEDLRKALGYKKWNLLGASYGSRLGLNIMRDFPDGIRSSVLAVSHTPEADALNNLIPNFENALFSILGRCEENDDCNSRYPNLKERLLKILKKLESDPLRFDLEGNPFIINPQDAWTVFNLSVYDRRSMADIPFLIEALENGETEPLVNILKGIENMYGLINRPMLNSVITYEELPFYDELAMIESLKQSEIAGNMLQYSDIGIEILNDWHPFRAADIENQPVVSEIPTLMVSGGLDHVTPVSNTTQALKHLKNGYEVIFPDDGHSLFNPCFFEITEDFLNNPTKRPDITCSSKRKPIEWNLTKFVQ